MIVIPHIPDPDVEPAIALGAQLGAGTLLLVISVVIHAAGILAATRFLGLEDRSLRAHRLDIRAFGLLVSIAICLFALHFIEIGLFAGFYLAVGALRDLESALYFSASAYSTLGQPDLDFPDDWRLLGAVEGLVGFVLIGWSTAVFITDMTKVLREEEEKGEREAGSRE
ncbi:MAG TPA: ion channel [Sphingomicrobium sp.]